jgi:cytochrome c oxidase subunit 1
MFQSGMNPALGATFMLSTMMIALPSAIKTFNWLGTMWGGRIQFTTPMLNAIGFVAMFVIGGLSGIFMAATPVDMHIHDTYFIVGHIHYVLFGGSTFAIFAGVYYWFPKMFGRMLDAKLGYIHFWFTFVGVYMIFFPMHYIGIAGFPRRYYSWTNFEFANLYSDLNMFVSVAAIITFFAQFIFLFNFFYSMYRGRKASLNPWNSTTLEWTTPLHPGHGNWPGEIPTVYRWPYDYSKPGAAEDFIPQTVPLSQTPESNLPHEQELVKVELEIMKDEADLVANGNKH